MRPGLAKIIENLLISKHFGSLQLSIPIAANAGCIDYAEPFPSDGVC